MTEAMTGTTYLFAGLFPLLATHLQVPRVYYITAKQGAGLRKDAHLGDAYLLDDVILSILLVFDKQSFPKRAFSNLLYPSVLIHGNAAA